ncbi:unnamed protein product [Schistosoma mattheei]|uniref:Uncharacterized protein n=1 Tax=Schistosoma mattheei TaxID=31246 RepID=A0A3P7ZT77_9TREM|nr:unnamed protein product [Schistosoma mattheei]
MTSALDKYVVFLFVELGECSATGVLRSISSSKSSCFNSSSVSCGDTNSSATEINVSGSVSSSFVECLLVSM